MFSFTLVAQQSTNIQFDEKQFSGSINYSFPLSKISWLKVGGPVDILFRPRNLDELSKFLSLVPAEVHVMPIGVCSNLLVRDGGLAGVAVKLGRNFSEIEVKDNQVKLGAGNLSSKVAISLSELGYDLSFLRTIPGTIGGALAMNAGCYGNYIGDYVQSIQGVDRSGKLFQVGRESLQFKYRSSSFPKNFIITSTIVKPKKEKQSSFWNNVFNNEEKTNNSGIVDQNLPSLSDIRVEDIAIPKADIVAA